jgi:hypothetical protein
MKFQLSSPWPIGDWFLPTGTILEPEPDGTFKFNGRVLPQPLPADAHPLDAKAEAQLREWYSSSGLSHLLRRLAP